MTDRETYLARAAEARADADAALLDNVRNRCLRSEKAWSDMANRAERTEKMRATLEADKAAAALVGEIPGTEPAKMEHDTQDETVRIAVSAQG